MHATTEPLWWLHWEDRVSPDLTKPYSSPLTTREAVPEKKQWTKDNQTSGTLTAGLSGNLHILHVVGSDQTHLSQDDDLTLQLILAI